MTTSLRDIGAVDTIQPVSRSGVDGLRGVSLDQLQSDIVDLLYNEIFINQQHTDGRCPEHGLQVTVMLFE